MPFRHFESREDPGDEVECYGCKNPSPIGPKPAMYFNITAKNGTETAVQSSIEKPDHNGLFIDPVKNN